MTPYKKTSGTAAPDVTLKAYQFLFKTGVLLQRLAVVKTRLIPLHEACRPLGFEMVFQCRQLPRSFLVPRNAPCAPCQAPHVIRFAAALGAVGLNAPEH